MLLVEQVPLGAEPGETGASLLELSPPAAGSRIVRVQWVGDEIVETNLTSGFVAAGQPALSFDAQRFLFVGRRSTDDNEAVFEMNIDGTGLRRIIAPAGGCDRPAYLSTVFTLDAEGPVEQIGFRSRVGKNGHTAIIRCRQDGTAATQITYAPEGVASPLLISDGRLLFSMRLNSAATPSVPSQSGTASTRSGTSTIGLVSVHTDGTDVFPFNEPMIGATRRALCETDDGLVVFAEIGGKDAEHGDALLSTSRTRPWITHRLNEVTPGTQFVAASALPTGQLLVASRPADAGRTFGIEMLDRATGRSEGVVYDTDAWHEVSAVPVEPRRVPAGRSTVVGSATTVGQLYCLNAYQGREEHPTGGERAHIANVRVYAWMDNDDVTASHAAEVNKGQEAPPEMRSRDRASHGPPREVVLGEAMVDADGSFFIELPAARPIRLETLDESGRTLQAMGTWFWVMPMERRGCIGCHEDRRLTPPNRHVLALRKPPQRMDCTAAEMREIEERDDQDIP